MSDNNLRIWNRYRKPPELALKKIRGGRLSGMTDINPVWRMLALTEFFGPVGIGWYTEIINHSTIEGANGEIVANVVVNLYTRTGADQEWSKPITGVGGAKLIAKEKSGLHTNDEAFKMAETDAISVCCKKLGIAADVYWEHGSKYTAPGAQNGSTNTKGRGKGQSSSTGEAGPLPGDNPMPDSFPTEAEMQQNYNQWVAAAKKFRKLSTFNEFLRDSDKQIKHDLGGPDSPFVDDFREWVSQRREELAE